MVRSIRIGKSFFQSSQRDILTGMTPEVRFTTREVQTTPATDLLFRWTDILSFDFKSLIFLFTLASTKRSHSTIKLRIETNEIEWGFILQAKIPVYFQMTSEELSWKEPCHLINHYITFEWKFIWKSTEAQHNRTDWNEAPVTLLFSWNWYKTA